VNVANNQVHAVTIMVACFGTFALL